MMIVFNLSSFVSSAVSQNWTIGTGGKNRWFYGQYSQLGSNGFFGPYNVDVVAGDFASLNGWMGVQGIDPPRNILVSGTNSSATAMSTELNPKVTFNWATVTGRYRLRPYDTATAPGSEVPISPGEWTHWGIGVTMPVGGAIFVGKSYFVHGCGLQFSWNRTQEFVLFESHPIEMPDFVGRLLPGLVRHPRIKPIGPVIVRICRAPKICPTDQERPKKDCSDGTNYLEFTSEEEISECLAAHPEECVEVDVCDACPAGMLPVKRTDPVTNTAHLYKVRRGTAVYETCDSSSYLKLGFGFLPWEQDFSLFSRTPSIISAEIPVGWNQFDVNRALRTNLLTYLLWNNDVINFEVGTLFSTSHVGPELARSTFSRFNYVPTDRYNSEGWVYLEFWNGPVRLRTELDWFTRQTRYQRSRSGNFFSVPATDRAEGSGSFFAPDFIESLRFLADARLQLGPTAFTVFYSHMPGPDRRHGILIKKQPFVRQLQQTGLDPFYSVSSLLAYRYGSGINSFGDLADASAIAGRVDYAVAANLNVSASFLHATRVSHGYGWGWIRPSNDPARFGAVDYEPDLQSYLVQPLPPDPPRYAFDEFIPAIPSRDLGWEVGLGLQWQLLDQFTVELTASYWQPGKWFNFACVDKSVAGWNNPTAANNWGVNPNRTIDPVLGIELLLLSSF